MRFPGRAVELLKIPAPVAAQLTDRITTLERDIILPTKVAGIAMLLYSFYFKRAWIVNKELGALEIAVEATQYFLWLYIAMNAVVAGLLLGMRRLPLPLVQWGVFAMILVDGIFLSALVALTDGYDSILYWLFLALIVRGAVSVPRATSQILLNLTLTACYVMAGVINISVVRSLADEAWFNAANQASPRHARAAIHEPAVAETRPRASIPASDHPEEASQENSGLNEPSDNLAQTLTLRLALLLLMTVCCYGVQVLLERQRRAVEEAGEFAMREGQLRSAGRPSLRIRSRTRWPSSTTPPSRCNGRSNKARPSPPSKSASSRRRSSTRTGSLRKSWATRS